MPTSAHPQYNIGDRIFVDASVFEIERRIKEGDESGWRGDPSMELTLNPANRRYEILARDLGGNIYVAASHNRCDHTLIQKLVAGDPRKHDVIQRVLDDNARLRVERAQAERDKSMAAHEKLQWALRRDFAAHMGGRTGAYSMYAGKKENA